MGLFDRFKKSAKENAAQTGQQEEAANRQQTKGMYSFVVQEIFSIKNHGTVVVGVVEGDTIRVGDAVYIIGREKKLMKGTVAGIENPSQGRMQEAVPGANVALMFREIDAMEFAKADVISNVEPMFEVDVNKPVVNPRLKGLLAERNHTTIEGLTGYILKELAVNANFLSVIMLSEEPTGTGDGTAVFQKDSTMQFPMLTSADGHNFYPVFTDWAEIYKWENRPGERTMILTFDSYTPMVLEGTADGIVINPFSDNLVLDKKLMEHLRTQKDINTKGVSKQKVKKDTQVLLGEPKEYPTEMIAAVKDYLRMESNVRTAWLRLMVKPEEGEQSYLVVVDCTGDEHDIFDNIARAARPHMNGMYVDMVSFRQDFGKKAAQGAEPFYSQDAF